jgi:hypothetical protein
MKKIFAKPAIVISCTLIIGMILGALLLSVIMYYRMQQLHHLMGRRGMHDRLIEALGPLSSAQRDAVKQEIEKSSIRIDSTFNAGRLQIDAMFDSMVVRLDLLLTEEQRIRLHQEVTRRRSMAPPRMGIPPPDGPPPEGFPPNGSPPDGPRPSDSHFDNPEAKFYSDQ